MEQSRKHFYPRRSQRSTSRTLVINCMISKKKCKKVKRREENRIEERVLTHLKDKNLFFTSEYIVEIH